MWMTSDSFVQNKRSISWNIFLNRERFRFLSGWNAKSLTLCWLQFKIAQKESANVYRTIFLKDLMRLICIFINLTFLVVANPVEDDDDGKKHLLN